MWEFYAQCANRKKNYKYSGYVPSISGPWTLSALVNRLWHHWSPATRSTEETSSAYCCVNNYRPIISKTLTNIQNSVAASKRAGHDNLAGGLLHLVQREGAWAGYGPTQSPLRCTKCKSRAPINGQRTNHCIDDGPFLCSFNVAIKGVTSSYGRCSAASETIHEFWQTAFCAWTTLETDWRIKNGDIFLRRNQLLYVPTCPSVAADMHSFPVLETIQTMRQTGSLWLVHIEDSSTGAVPRRVSKNASWPFCMPPPSTYSSFELYSIDVRWCGGFSTSSGDTECTAITITMGITTRAAMVVLLSVVSVYGCGVYVLVCQRDNSWTVWDIITKFYDSKISSIKRGQVRKRLLSDALANSVGGVAAWGQSGMDSPLTGGDLTSLSRSIVSAAESFNWCTFINSATVQKLRMYTSVTVTVKKER